MVGALRPKRGGMPRRRRRRPARIGSDVQWSVRGTATAEQRLMEIWFLFAAAGFALVAILALVLALDLA